jgi:hypothetical protein
MARTKVGCRTVAPRSHRAQLLGVTPISFANPICVSSSASRSLRSSPLANWGFVLALGFIAKLYSMVRCYCLAMGAQEKFWARVDRTGTAYPTPERVMGPERGPCWLWTTGKDRRRPGGEGYGRFKFNGKWVLAHRFAYERLIGPIPDGLTLDHECRVRPCCNPEHTDPVTNRENILRGNGTAAQHARQTHCVRRHEFDEANTRLRTDGSRACRACNAEGVHRRYLARRG